MQSSGNHNDVKFLVDNFQMPILDLIQTITEKKGYSLPQKNLSQTKSGAPNTDIASLCIGCTICVS